MSTEPVSPLLNPSITLTRMARLPYLGVVALAALIFAADVFWLVYSPPFAGLVAGLILTAAVLFVGSMRRLRDLDVSAGAAIALFVPVAGFIMLAILSTAEGSANANRYGPAPAPLDDSAQGLLIALVLAGAGAAVWVGYVVYEFTHTPIKLW